jgi:hypothetical protein
VTGYRRRGRFRPLEIAYPGIANVDDELDEYLEAAPGITVAVASEGARRRDDLDRGGARGHAVHVQAIIALGARARGDESASPDLSPLSSDPGASARREYERRRDRRAERVRGRFEQFPGELADPFA